MALPTSVKYFHSLMTGATAIAVTPGALIAVLDSCLVTGFGVKTATTVTVASGIATVNIAAGAHSFEKDAVMLVSGATPAGLNGEKRVLSTSTNDITFDATGISDQTATGTITVKIAPVGWEKIFSATNVAVYRSTDVTGTRMFLRVDDTGTTSARVVAYESMSDVNTGTGKFPTEIQVSGGLYWPKGNQPYSGWTIVADSRTLYLHTSGTAALNLVGIAGVIYGFGDFSSFKPGDPYSAFLTGGNSNIASNTGTTYSCMSGSFVNADLNYSGTVVARSYTGLGGSAVVAKLAESYVCGTNTLSGSTVQLTLYPNPVDNSLLVSNYVLMEASPCVRGRLRGILYVSQPSHPYYEWRQKMDGQGSLTGRQLMVIKAGAPIASASVAMNLFDIYGPWG